MLFQSWGVAFPHPPTLGGHSQSCSSLLFPTQRAGSGSGVGRTRFSVTAGGVEASSTQVWGDPPGRHTSRDIFPSDDSMQGEKKLPSFDFKLKK